MLETRDQSLNLLILSVKIMIIFNKLRILGLIFIAGAQCKDENFFFKRLRIFKMALLKLRF